MKGWGEPGFVARPGKRCGEVAQFRLAELRAGFQRSSHWPREKASTGASPSPKKLLWATNDLECHVAQPGRHATHQNTFDTRPKTNFSRQNSRGAAS